MQLLGFLWQHVKKEQRNLALVGVMLLLNTSLAIFAPVFFRNALNLLEDVNDSEKEMLTKSLYSALLIYMILTVLSWFAEATQFIITTHLNAKVIRELRFETYQSLIKNKIEFFDENESGDLVSIVTNDLKELYETGNAFAEVLTSLFRLLAIIVILFYFSPVLTLTSILLMPIFFIITVSVRNYQRRVEKRWRANFGKVNQAFAENMRSIAISKAYNREDENNKRFIELNEATYQASIRRGFAIFINRPTGDFLRNIMLIVLLAVGSWQVQTRGLSVATFYLFIFLIDYYYQPIRSLSRNYNRFQSLFVNLERILAITENLNTEDNLGDKSAKNMAGKIEFDNVTFSYVKDINVLQKISFKAEKGSRIALVGHTGAGKTTIASLILKFYDLNSGSIKIDGIDIKDFDLYSLRKNISLVSQRVLLFKGTIRSNLQIANPQATDEEIWDALDAVQARDFIEELPDRLNTEVIEGGRNLSSGQRQMISFARALLSKPKMIVLDEATSAVDLYTESRIQDSTDLLLSGRTSIVIAHRLTTILKSDLIVVLEAGMVKQTGTHEDLMKQDAPYQEMYNLYFETQSAKYLETIKVKSE